MPTQAADVARNSCESVNFWLLRIAFARRSPFVYAE